MAELKAKKNWLHKESCTGIGCPLAAACQTHRNDPARSEFRIRPPFKKSGNTVKCDSYKPHGSPN